MFQVGQIVEVRPINQDVPAFRAMVLENRNIKDDDHGWYTVRNLDTQVIHDALPLVMNAIPEGEPVRDCACYEGQWTEHAEHVYMVKRQNWRGGGTELIRCPGKTAATVL